MIIVGEVPWKFPESVLAVTGSVPTSGVTIYCRESVPLTEVIV
jgi:hypothetical protein